MRMRIEQGHLADEFHADAARLVHTGFQAKARAFTSDTGAAVEAIQESFAIERGFFAFDDGNLVGVAGVDTPTDPFLHFRYRTLLRHLNPLKAAVAAVFLNYNRRVRPTEVRLTTIAVAQDSQGQGVGTALIHRAEDFARAGGYEAITLEVVDTNTGAHRLYEKLGFEDAHTARYGFLTRRAGFSASTLMLRDL